MGLRDIIKPERVHDPEPMEKIRAWKPDVIVVVAFGQILKKPLLDLPLFGCVNCHFSLLPKYRGAAPVVAALEAGERMTGVTVMKMGVGLDDGPIMLQSFEPIYPDTIGGQLMDDLAIAGGVTLAKALRLLSANALPPEVKQDEGSATYARKLKKTDGLINWDQPVIEIERRIRAYNPWPCCYTFLPENMRKRGNTGRVVVLRARVAKLEPSWKSASPGTVVKIDKAGPIVRCHDTALQLLEVKPEGSSCMDGGAFCRGRQLVPGETAFLMS
jgi:methionyl-tRNA formyltransferase